MRIEHTRTDIKKGWYAGPWNSDLPISLGFANEGVDEPHKHERITEVYLVGRGSAIIRVEHETVSLIAGDMLVIEPGEAHTFIDSSDDYFHYVVHIPGLSGEAAANDKIDVRLSEMGL